MRRRTHTALLGLIFVSAISAVSAAGDHQPAGHPAGRLAVSTAPHRAPATAPSLRSMQLRPQSITIARIIASQVHTTTAYRLRAHEPIIVLEFASLHTQALMLNRVAVVIEKKGAPRDRILNETELTRFIRATGSNYDTFYDGHDYKAADLSRFFRIAMRDHVSLNAEEIRLRTLAGQENWRGSASVGALISIPAVGSGIDEPARETILRHELSHAAYFTDPRYAALARDFWKTALTDKERRAIREFLASQDYDPAIEDLMINEGQAYLFNTPLPRFFTPSMVAMTNERHAQLQQAFLNRIPPGWFRDFVFRPTAPSRDPSSLPTRRHARA